VADTHCPYCSLQCGIMLTPRPDGSLELAGRPDFPVNRGGLCRKGATAAELLDHPERLTTPLEIVEGDAVRLRTVRGDAVLHARLDTGIRRDTVFVPFHWGGAACINELTSDALDPTSRMPAFKACPVAVEKAASAVFAEPTPTEPAIAGI
jgi:anaerobic selenocysteine-containing dehydrogenase